MSGEGLDGDGTKPQSAPALKGNADLHPDSLSGIYDAATFGIAIIEQEEDTHKSLRKLKVVLAAIQAELTMGTGIEQPSGDPTILSVPCRDCYRFNRVGTPAFCDCINTCF